MRSRECLFAAASALAVLCVLFPASAAPPDNADPRLAPWFNSLTQPDTGVGCCSISDCRPVLSFIRPTGYAVFIEDDRAKALPGAVFGEERNEVGEIVQGYEVPVPADKVLQGKDNPVGRAVVCWTPALGIMCFVRGTET